jgi:hypothetical protein
MPCPRLRHAVGSYRYSPGHDVGWRRVAARDPGLRLSAGHAGYAGTGTGGLVHLTPIETEVFVGAAPVLVGTVLGASLTQLQQRRSEAKADRDRLRRDSAELLAACGDLILSLQSLRSRYLGPLAEYRRTLKVVLDFFARVDPGAWKDWRTARDNGLPAMAGAGSELITSDRAELQEAGRVMVPPMSRIYLAVASLRSAVDERFQAQLGKLVDATTDLPGAYAKRSTWDKAVARLNAEVRAMNKEVDRLTTPPRRRIAIPAAQRRRGRAALGGAGDGPAD